MSKKMADNKKKKSIKLFLHKYVVGYSMVIPFYILFILFVIIPVFLAFGLSFTNFNMIQLPKFVGVDNYVKLFLDDKIFWKAMNNTLVYALIVGPLGFFMSFFAAWILNGLKMRNLFALAFYAPSICSGVAMSTIWLYFFSPDRYGLINNVFIDLNIINDPILWTRDPDYILPVIIVIAIWMSMGTGFLVFLAGLQNVDRSLYEAAYIDGMGTKWQELKYITLPQMKPQLLFGAINAITNSFGVFDIAVSVAGLPSPNYSGHTIVAHLYDYAFIRSEMGYASGVATILFIITFLIGRIVMRALSDKDPTARRQRNE